MNAPIENSQDMLWDTYLTPEVRDYWALYLSNCNETRNMVHLKVSAEVVGQITDDGQAAIDAVFNTLETPPAHIDTAFSYEEITQRAAGRRVIVVSPFAKLMKEQAQSGNLAKLRPAFTPSELSWYSFPYCYGNKGPHENSFETIEAVSTALQAEAGPDTLVMLSCGSMGVPIADRLHKGGADTFYCGGAMQLFFGIMGGRWRRPGFNGSCFEPKGRLACQP